jgi:cob(I)alamin adenosyltransferase
MIQVYTGNGKGKTTAALGLALRAAGSGLKVYICQFLKGKESGESAALKKFKNIKIEKFGTSSFIRSQVKDHDIKLAAAGLKVARKAVLSKRYSLIILDEICVALKLGLVSLNDLLAILDCVSKDTELILTGRCAHPKIIEKADLVSDIRDKKHYYNNGVKARKGIEF